MIPPLIISVFFFDEQNEDRVVPGRDVEGHGLSREDLDLAVVDEELVFAFFQEPDFDLAVV